MAPLNDKAYCPSVGVGQTVYLRHRPVGRHKIQDSWAPVVYRVEEVQGTTYMVEPVEGGPQKRVHRVDLRPCERPVVETAEAVSRVTAPVAKFPSDSVEAEPVDPECVILEEVTLPHVEETRDVEMEVSGSAEETLAVGRDCVLENEGQLPSELEHTGKEGIVLVADRPVPKKPVPAPRRTSRVNAGVHPNPFNEPRSACNSVSTCPEVFSQVLTSLGSVFFREAVNEVRNQH